MSQDLPPAAENRTDNIAQNNACDEMPEEVKNPPISALKDDILSSYQQVNRENLIQRLLLKKWSILHEIELFLIDAWDNYFNYSIDNKENNNHSDSSNTPPHGEAIDNLWPMNMNNEEFVRLIKKQNQLRSQNGLNYHHSRIMQTSKNIQQLRLLSIDELNEILHDFDTFQQDIRELIAAQHGTLVFTSMSIDETISHLLKGYQTVCRY